MKKIATLVAALVLAANLSAQTLLTESFSSGQVSPAWIQFSDTNTAYDEWPQDEIWSCWFGSQFGNPAPCAASICYFTNDNFTAADRWLVTPALSIPASMTEAYISLDAMSFYEQTWLESFEIRVCTTTPNSPADFEPTPLLSVEDVPGTGWTEYRASLAAYAGQTVHLAVRHTSYDKFILLIDNIFVGQRGNTEVSLDALRMPAYAGQNTPFTVGGTLVNRGTDTITSFTASLIIDGTDTASALINTTYGVGYNCAYNFTLPNPAIIATEGTHHVELLLSLPNGRPDHEDDNTLSDSVIVYDPAPTFPRTTLLEEFTTAKCSNCPSAMNRIHSALMGRDDVILMARHAGYYTDDMTTQDDRDLLWLYNAGGSTYAPAAMLNRTYFSAFCDEQSPVFYPGSGIGDYIAAAACRPAYAQVELSGLAFDPATRQLSLTVSGTLNRTLADARLSVVLVQDSIYRSQAGASGSNYRHDNVYRLSLLDGAWGRPISQGTFSENISVTLPESIGNVELHAWRCRVVALVANRNSNDPTDCAVENAAMSSNLEAPYVAISQAPEAEEVLSQECYDLLGRRVDNPGKGVYLLRTISTHGVSTRKVIR